MSRTDVEFQNYPDASSIDEWLERIWRAAHQLSCAIEPLAPHEFEPSYGVRHLRGARYVRFTPDGREPFYALWQPAPSQPAPLLVHTPGYGAEISAHPDLVALGFNVLHVNPLGYVTPAGLDTSKMRDGTWPVWPDTALSGGEHGYHEWLTDVLLAITWAQSQDAVLPERLSFFGTSQGGFASLVLGSLYSGRGARCVAADVPATNFLLHKPPTEEGVNPLFDYIAHMDNPAEGWRAVGFIDPASHVHRLTMPVLLTAGADDDVCPAATIEALFGELPGTRALCCLDSQGHGYTQEFITLAGSWFRLYA